MPATRGGGVSSVGVGENQMVANGTNGVVDDDSGELMPLVGCSQHESWGMASTSGSCLAARLHALCSGSGGIREGTTSGFALGTHADAHTVLADDRSRTLLDYIRTEVIEVESGKVEHYARLHRHGLPFVVRVLSVGKPQAIHVHPDGTTPGDWGDALGRAEMALALSPCEALFGFRAAAGIVSELARVPEFADAVGRPAVDAFVHAVKTGAGARHGIGSALRALFSSFMGADDAHVQDCLAGAVERFGRMPANSLTGTDRLLLRVHADFPGDGMCFGVYFLNWVRWGAGEAVFIHPGEPHAYLSGNLVEVSSSSANVVRAGLTPLECDKKRFVSMLNYDDSPVEVSTGEKRGEHATEFLPPVDEFMLGKYDVPAGKDEMLSVAMAPTILVVLGGEGYIVCGSAPHPTHTRAVHAGCAYYVRAGSQVVLRGAAAAGCTAQSEGGGGMHAVRVGINESTAPEGGCVIS